VAQYIDYPENRRVQLTQRVRSASHSSGARVTACHRVPLTWRRPSSTRMKACADWLMVLSRLRLRSACGGGTRLIMGGAPAVSCLEAGGRRALNRQGPRHICRQTTNEWSQTVIVCNRVNAGGALQRTAVDSLTLSYRFNMYSE
jgi:hypothetical protein